MMSLLFAQWIQMLVIYSPSWFTIFLGSNEHRATPISGHANRYWSYDTPFHIFLKGLPYWFFKVERHWNWVMSGFRECSLFKVDVGSGARHRWEYLVFKWHFGEMLQGPTLEPIDVCFSWEKRKVFWMLWHLIPTPHQI